jgi:hypothetical protein
MTWLTLVALLLTHPEPHIGRGTVFGPWHLDRHAGHRAACDYPRRRALASPEALELFAGGDFVAHRTWPCWAIVEVCSVASGRCRRAVVADRGPARALVDLWHRLAARLGHDGERVLVFEAEP